MSITVKIVSNVPDGKEARVQIDNKGEAIELFVLNAGETAEKVITGAQFITVTAGDKGWLDK